MITRTNHAINKKKTNKKKLVFAVLVFLCLSVIIIMNTSDNIPEEMLKMYLKYIGIELNAVEIITEATIKKSAM